MKAKLSEEFYRKNQDRFFEKYQKDCDFEYHLKIRLMRRDFSIIPEEIREQAKAIITKTFAKEVYDASREELVKKMQMIKEVEAGKAGLGYTNTAQKYQAMHDLREGFEFSCLMLADFKKKYEL